MDYGYKRLNVNTVVVFDISDELDTKELFSVTVSGDVKDNIYQALNNNGLVSSADYSDSFGDYADSKEIEIVRIG